MPLRDYTTDADWDAAYSPVAPRVQSHAEYTDYEWRQPDMTWGAIETRVGPPYYRRQKRIRFSAAPLRWQVNYQGEQDLPEAWYDRRNTILAEHPIALTDRVLVVGAGTGVLVRAFRDVGYTAVFGLEPSDWIQGNALHMWGDVVLVDSDITQGNQLKARLRNGTGDDEFTWIIDEEMSTGYTDAELVEIRVNPSTRWIDLPELLLSPGVPHSHIIHLVRTSGDPTIVNVHPIEWWQALDPAHSWMEVW